MRSTSGGDLQMDGSRDQYKEDPSHGMHAGKDSGPIVTGLVPTHAGGKGRTGRGQVGETRGGVPEVWKHHAE